MVKTRHSGGLNESDYSAFLSLSPRATRRHTSYVEEKSKDRSGVQSRKSKSSKDLSSDEFEESVHTPARFRSRRRKPILHVAEESLSADDTVFKHNDTTSQHVRRSSRRPVFRGDNNPYAKPRYDASSPTRSAARSESGMGDIPVGKSPDTIPCELLNGDVEGTRRSTRQKKLMYNTFNQTVIDKQLSMLDGIEDSHAGNRTRMNDKAAPYPKRRKVEVEPIPEEEQNGDSSQENQMVDMYTRVKRIRRSVKRNMYGVPIKDDDEENTEGSDDEDKEEDDDEETEESSSSSEEEQEQGPGKYFLREHKPRTALYEAPPIEPQRRPPRNFFHHTSPPRRAKPRSAAAIYRSPARRKNFKRGRRKRAFHGDSSTSSSSSSGGDSSDDERRFEKRKSKSMHRSRQRCLPMNLEKDDISQGVLRDRQRIGSSLADIDPMNVDKSVSFEQVGGLGKHVRSLKEMILFPLMYPEVFEKFKISPPRGVLFHGPPGTGKTLIARALANECSIGNRKVAFFMRKGADCLSKWVGESERQLRLLFDQAFQLRPSIIFFDEIDGLAPVRSSRQDQIHSSIVSTLLALMDGLDNRGEVVVIGATNRIDSIDPALRRPGRFDREFLFPLPSKEARQQILTIHTSAWNPKLSQPFLTDLSEQCVGYCGADLKALCTEAALHALRRRYPQIYTSQDKLQLDVSKINVSARDFHHGMQVIVPASQRAVASPGRALAPAVKPLLQNTFEQTLRVLNKVFPSAITKLNSLDVPGSNGESSSVPANGELDLYSDEEDDDETTDIYEKRGRGRSVDPKAKDYFQFSAFGFCGPTTHRPRLLIEGEEGQGQSSHVAPAILYYLERIPVHTLDLPALFGVSARTPEESCAQIFREAKRTAPSVIYMPHIHQWWDVITDTLKATFLTMLYDLEPSSPILLLATSEDIYSSLPFDIRNIFDRNAQEVVAMRNPTDTERKEYFEKLFLHQAIKPPSSRKVSAKRMLEVLPKAPPPAPRKLTDAELKKLHQQEENTLRELRLFLRDILNKLGRDRKFSIFAKPVDQEEVPDYYQVIEKPMDLSTMMSKIDLHKYSTVAEFLEDIDLICSNALEYNPDRDPQDRAIRHRACELRDASQALINAELDADFEKMCKEIAESRKRRGESSSVAVPSYYYARPAENYQPGVRKELVENAINSYPSRYSRRTRGMPAEEESNNAENTEDPEGDAPEEGQEEKPKYQIIVKRIPIKRSSAGLPSYKAKSPWLRTGKRKFKKVYYYVDEFGNQFPADDLNKSESASQDKTDSKDNTKEECENDAENDDEKAKEESEEKEETESKIENDEKETDDKEKTAEKLTNGVLDSEEEEALNRDTVTPKTRFSLRDSSLSTRSKTTSPRGGTRSAGNSPGRAAVITPKTSGSSPIRTAGRSPNASTSPKASTSGISPGRTDKPANASNITPGKPQGTTEETAHKDDGPQEIINTPVTTRRTRKSVGEAEPMEVSPSTSSSAPVATNGEKAEPKNDERSSQKNETPEKAKDESNEPAQRITRSHIHSAQAKRAKEILDEEDKSLVIDKQRLEALLDETVDRTTGYNVDKLERLHSILSQCIYVHRREYDRTTMIDELESVVRMYTSNS